MARTFKCAKDAYESYEHSYGVMAMTDSLVDRLCNENKTLRGEVNEMKNQIAELQRGHKLLEGQYDILFDQADSLHYGLVMLGGYTISFRTDTGAKTAHVHDRESKPGSSSYYGGKQIHVNCDATESRRGTWRRH